MGETIEIPSKDYIEMSFTHETATGKGLNNSFIMENLGDGTFKCTEGRIGITIGVHKPKVKYMNIDEWDSLYELKTKLGYTVVSLRKREMREISKSRCINGKTFKPLENKAVQAAIDKIVRYAKNLVETEYTVKVKDVTDIMINSGKEVLDDMALNYEKMSVAEFNNKLKRLYAVIPRRIDNLSKSLAARNADFADIIAKEQELYDVITTQAMQESKLDNEKTITEAFGLEWREVTEEEEAYIKKKLGSESGRYRKAWKITNHATQKRFDDFCYQRGFTRENGKIKNLFHGSRSENFWSIITNGLTINPTGVVITGKMFGNGTYFAPDACKSMGYTSRSGSRWAGGSDSVGYLGIYSVAIGNPASPGSVRSYSYSSLEKDGYNSVWCKRGGQIGLRMDEVVVYNDAQDTINYLVEVGM